MSFSLSFGRRIKTAVGPELQARVWDRRAATWDEGASPGLGRVVGAVLEQAAPRPGDVAVDLGCGTGELALPLGRAGATVKGVDVSPVMIDRMAARAAAEGVDGITGVVASIEQVAFDPASVDLVVSNYALHHIADSDKEAVVGRAAGWLRPGGRIVIGDMMFGRGRTSQDRAIIRGKLAVLAKRGPAGWWRIVKNVFRFTARVQERPVSAAQWRQYLEQAGFADITILPVVGEASVAVATRK